MKKYNKTYVGFTKFCIFSTHLEGIIESDLSEASIKKALGENAVIIKKGNIGGIKVIQNKACGVLIEAKGLGDDIGVVAGSQEAQNALVNEIAKFLEFQYYKQSHFSSYVILFPSAVLGYFVTKKWV